MVTVRADAGNRAWRTFVQGLLVDLVVAVSLAVSTSIADVAWTRVYWAGLGLLVVKTVAQSAASYIARHITPPPGA